MMRERRPLRSLLLATAVIAVGSGCVFQRFAEFQAQLAAFERNFEVDGSSGFSLRALHPVLERDDLHWLSLRPSQVTLANKLETWKVRWVSETAATKSANPAAVEVELAFAEGKFSTATVGPQYWSPEIQALFSRLAHRVASAKIDKLHRRLSATLELPPAENFTRQQLAPLETILGPPWEIRTHGSLNYRLYRFSSRSVNGTVAHAELFLAFDSAETLREFRVKLPAGTMVFTFAVPSARL